MEYLKLINAIVSVMGCLSGFVVWWNAIDKEMAIVEYKRESMSLAEFCYVVFKHTLFMALYGMAMVSLGAGYGY